MIFTSAGGDENDLRMFYDAVQSRLNVSFEIFSASLLAWDIIRVFDDSRMIALVAIKDGFAHIVSSGIERIGIPRMRRLIRTLGVTKTAVSNEYRKGHALAKRLGFTETHSNNGVTYYGKT